RAARAREMALRRGRRRGGRRGARGRASRRAARPGGSLGARRPAPRGRPAGGRPRRVSGLRRAESARSGERSLPACAGLSGSRGRRTGPRAFTVCSRDCASLPRGPANVIGDRTLSVEQQNALETEETRELIKSFHESFGRIRTEVRKVIVGQDEVVDSLLLTLLVGGHCLITGMPGTAKTLLVRTLAYALGLTFKRIQFTPDLMPTDVTGTDIIEE